MWWGGEEQKNMSEICAKCGLPKELCVCETIARSEQRIKVMVIKRRFGKMITLIGGLQQNNLALDDITKKLKSALACGGTVKDGKIELQGDHKNKIKKELVKLGFNENLIDM